MAMVFIQYNHHKSKYLYSCQKLLESWNCYSSSFFLLLLPCDGIPGRGRLSGQALGNGVQFYVKTMHSSLFRAICFGSEL